MIAAARPINCFCSILLAVPFPAAQQIEFSFKAFPLYQIRVCPPGSQNVGCKHSRELGVNTLFLSVLLL